MNSPSRSKQDKSIFQSITPETARKKREEQSLSIRKNKRNESLIKRRMNNPDEMMPPTQDQNGKTMGQQTNNENISSPNVGLFGVIPAKLTPSRIEEIPRYLEMISSGDPKQQFEATIRFRKLLSIEKNPPIEVVLNSGIVPTLVNFLRVEQYPKLQFEAAWALTNIASGTSDQTRVIVEYGACQVFITLLRSSDPELREQAVWALGNIAGDSIACRDFLINNEIVPPLLTILSAGDNNKLTMQRNAAWCLSNLCRGKPQPNFGKLSISLNILGQLLNSSDLEVLVDACWAVSYLCDGTEETIDVVIHSGLLPRLVQLVSHPSASVQTPALRALGNITTGNDKQTQLVLDLQVLPPLLQLLCSSRKTIKKEAAWVISNMTAGNKNQTQQIIASGVMQQLVQLMDFSDFDVRKEAAWAVSNATSWRVPEQIRFIVQCDAIKHFINFLECKDNAAIGFTLEALENIFYVGERISKHSNENPYITIFEDLNGISKLEDLTDIDNRQLYDKVVKLLDEYWTEEESESALPSSSSSSMSSSNQNRQIQPFQYSLPVSVPQGGFHFQ